VPLMLHNKVMECLLFVLLSVHALENQEDAGWLLPSIWYAY